MARSYRDDEDDRNTRKKMLAYCVLAASLVMLGFLYMLYQNNEERHKRLAAREKQQKEELEKLQAEQEELKELGVGENNLRSEDLDFWSMYDPEKYSTPGNTQDTLNEAPDKRYDYKPPVTPLPKQGENAENGPEGQVNIPGRAEDDADSDTAAQDGKHIGVTDASGKTVYYEIMDDVAPNEYAMESCLSMKNRRLSYNDGDIRSLNGVAVSKSQGAIDWARVKADGIDFAMIKVASRGYESGIISLDDLFVANSRGAVANGVAVGAYFSTQAISEAEAIEEANFTVGAIAQYGITYPVAIHIENIRNDSARTETLTMEERTSYVKTWLDTVKSFGYTPMIYAERNTLIRDIDLSKLKGYSIFLSDPADFTLAKEKGLSADPAPKPTGSANQAPGSASSSMWSTPPSYPSGTVPGVSSSYQTSSASLVTALANRPSSSDDKRKTDSSTDDKTKTDPVSDYAEGEGTAEKQEEKWYTDFPYRFSIWQYDPIGTVDGINGSVAVNIGFIDYSKR